MQFVTEQEQGYEIEIQKVRLFPTGTRQVKFLNRSIILSPKVPPNYD